MRCLLDSGLEGRVVPLTTLVECNEHGLGSLDSRFTNGELWNCVDDDVTLAGGASSVTHLM